MNNVFEYAGLPLIRVRAAGGYDREVLSAVIDEAINVHSGVLPNDLDLPGMKDINLLMAVPGRV